MRRLLGFLLATLSVAAVSSVHAEDWFRMNVSPTVLFQSGEAVPPDGGTNNHINITVDAIGSKRRSDSLSVAVTVNGMAATDTMDVVGLTSGLAWTGTGSSSGMLSATYLEQGTLRPTVEVRSAVGTLLAQSELEIVVHPTLAATVPNTTFETAVGDDITIVPTVTGLVEPGAVQWGTTPSPLPEWLDLDETTGAIAVDATASNSISNVVLTAVDQTDMADASTNAFSVRVKGACDVWVQRTTPSLTGNFFNVGYGAGTYVAIGSAGQALVSDDALSWTLHPFPADLGWASHTAVVGSWPCPSQHTGR